MSDKNLKLPSEYIEPIILSYCYHNQSYFIKIKDWLNTKDKKGISYFNDSKLQDIFNVIATFFNKYERLPNKTTLKSVIDKIEKDEEVKLYKLSIIDKIFDTKLEEIDTTYIEEETLKFIKEAKAYEVIIDSSKYINDENYEGFITDMEEISKINFDKDLGVSIKEADKIYDLFQDLGDQKTVTTGFRNLNSFLDSGFKARELTVFSSTPGVGKCVKNNVKVRVRVKVDTENKRII